MSFQAHVACGVYRVFEIVADLRAYDRWLPRSAAFRGTTDVSHGAIGVGTTYVERTPGSQRLGKIVAFDPPHRVAFEQPMTLTNPALSWCGRLDIRVDYALIETGDGVRVTRDVRIEPRGVVRLAGALLRAPFRAENQRVVDALKTFAEHKP